MIRVKLPRLEKRDAKVLEKLDLEQFLAGVDGHDWLHILLMLDAGTGCRRGELLALTWTDIDADTAVLCRSASLLPRLKRGASS